ncbi:hypothetical protein ABZP36_036087 [Zizania latifolia]
MGEEAVVVVEAPRPKSPPRYPDLCGRRRMQLEVQIMNREITFLKFACCLKEGHGQGKLSGLVRQALMSYTYLKELNRFLVLDALKKRKGGTDPAVFIGGSDRNCVSAFLGFAAVASAYPSAEDQVQAAAHAVVKTAVPSRPLRAANRTARPAVQAAAHVVVHRAANQAVAVSTSLHVSNLCVAASRSLHASNHSAAASAQIAAAAVARAAAFQAVAARAAASGLAVNANQNVACVLAIAATASLVAAVVTNSAAAVPTAAPARALDAPAATTSSDAPAVAARTCASVFTASHRAARDTLRAASASHRAARASLAASQETAAATFQNRRVLNVPVGVFGLAENVQKGGDAHGVEIHAVSVDAYVELDPFSMVIFVVVSS